MKKKPLIGWVILLAIGACVIWLTISPRACQLCLESIAPPPRVDSVNAAIGAEKFRKADSLLQLLEAEIDPESIESGFVHLSRGDLAYNTYQRPLAARHYRVAHQIWQLVLLPNHHLTKKAANYAGYTYYKIGMIDSAIYYFEEEYVLDSLGQEREPVEGHHLSLAGTASNLASCYGQWGDYHEQLKAFQRAWHLVGKDTASQDSSVLQQVAKIRKNLGVGYYYLSESQPAIHHLHGACELLVKAFPDSNHQDIMLSYAALANVYAAVENGDSALLWAQTAHTLYEQYGQANLDLGVVVYQAIGNSMRAAGKWELALDYYGQVLEWMKTLPSSDPFSIASIWHERGGAFFVGERYDSAVVNFAKSVQAFHDQGVYHHPGLTHSFNAWGRSLFLQGSYEAAHRICEMGVEANQPPDSLISLLRTDSSDFPVIFSNWSLLSSLSGKASAAFQQAKQTGSARWESIAWETYQQFQKQAIRTRQEMLQNRMGGKVLTGEIAHSFEGALGLAYQRYQSSSEANYLEAALQMIQTYHARSLQEMLLARWANQFTEVPASLLQQVKQTEIQIRFLKDSLIHAYLTRTETQDERGQIWQQRYPLEVQRYDSLLGELVRVAPRYHQMKYKPYLLSLQDAYQILPDQKTSLIHFLVGDTATYVVGIHPENSFFHHLPLGETEIAAWVGQYREWIEKKPHSTENQRQIDSLGAILYQGLLAPWLDKTAQNDLIIIPDGSLHHLPFEALPLKLEEHTPVRYLIEERVVSYSFTLGDRMIEPTQPSPGTEWIGFAPTFDQKMMQAYQAQVAQQNPIDAQYLALDPLYETPKLLEKISSQYGGDTYLGLNAQEKIFRKVGDQAKILCLATHGAIDSLRPIRSMVMFAKPSPDAESENDGRLYVHELFGMDIEAELTILLACQTGSGTVAKGEGITSIASGFRYAGCPSLIMSLWEIEQSASIQLVETFYAYLQAGATRKDALRGAKLDLMKTYPHPYFWSGLVLMGKTDEIKF